MIGRAHAMPSKHIEALHSASTKRPKPEHGRSSGDPSQGRRRKCRQKQARVDIARGMSGHAVRIRSARISRLACLRGMKRYCSGGYSYPATARRIRRSRAGPPTHYRKFCGQYRPPGFPIAISRGWIEPFRESSKGEYRIDREAAARPIFSRARKTIQPAKTSS